MINSLFRNVRRTKFEWLLRPYTCDSKFPPVDEINADEHDLESELDSDHENESSVIAPNPTHDKHRHTEFRLHSYMKTHMPNICPSTTSVLLFPGQGSQFVGMGKLLLSYDHPTINRMFESAGTILKRNMKTLCLEGPQNKLDATIHCQPAIYLVSLAAAVYLREQQPQLLERCVAAAGFSVGEISALVFAGAMDFEDGLHLIRVRAEAMQRACDECSGGMATLFLSHDSKRGALFQAARNYCKNMLKIEEPVCTVANHLFPECVVASGHVEAIEYIEKFYKVYNIRRVFRLPVSGAFHTPLMRSAKYSVKNALMKLDLEDRIRTPNILVLSNVDGMPMRGVGRIIRMCSLQVTATVKWHQCMQVLFGRPQGTPFPHVFEVGPGKQLGTVLKAANTSAFANYNKVDV